MESHTAVEWSTVYLEDREPFGKEYLIFCGCEKLTCALEINQCHISIYMWKDGTLVRKPTLTYTTWTLDLYGM